MPHKNPETRREYERERHRRRTAERLARGACPKCGKRPPAQGRSLCEFCLERGRMSERARYAKARGEGARYGGRSPESRRRMARERARKQCRRERLEAGRCTTCGERKPLKGGAVCGNCRETRRAAEKKLYGNRRSSGRCGRCGAIVIEKASTCASCAARDVKRRPKKNAASRKRYRDRRALGICVDCSLCGIPHNETLCEVHGYVEFIFEFVVFGRFWGSELPITFASSLLSAPVLRAPIHNRRLRCPIRHDSILSHNAG